MLRTVLGRTGDVCQLALGAAFLRPAFRWLREARPNVALRMRHEPYAARGEEFVRSVGRFEKAAFVAKMLGTNGGWSSDRREEGPVDRLAIAPEELLIAGDVLYPGRLAEDSLSDALRARIARASAFVVNLEATVSTEAHELAPLLTARGLGQLLAYEKDPHTVDWVSRIDAGGLRALLACTRRPLATVANNHTLDDGLEGFARTVQLVRDLGVEVVGDARSDAGAKIVTLGPHRGALFAFAYGSNRRDSEPCHLRFDAVPYRLDRARIAALVSTVRAQGATHAVAVLHWGYEHEHEPAPEQRRCVDVLFEEGFSAVVGHHPHVMQPTETGDGRWVSYSLGDFIGGDRTIWSRFGAMVALRFGADGAVRGELVPVVQTPFWEKHATMLLSDAPPFERAVFARWFTTKLPRARRSS